MEDHRRRVEERRVDAENWRDNEKRKIRKLKEELNDILKDDRPPSPIIIRQQQQQQQQQRQRQQHSKFSRLIRPSIIKDGYKKEEAAAFHP